VWRDLEEPVHEPQPADWRQALQAAFSGFVICVLILAAFAAAGSPANF
jgi:hypothetical protein